MMNRCLYCYEPLVDREVDYHAKCCRKLFGMPQAPILPYTSSEVRALADEVVRSQTTVTGVQPKLFLDFDQMSHSPKRFTIVGLWGRFILKPQTERYPHLPELEDVSMHLAEIAKIENSSSWTDAIQRWRTMLHHSSHRPNRARGKAPNGRYVSVVRALNGV